MTVFCRYGNSSDFYTDRTQGVRRYAFFTGPENSHQTKMVPDIEGGTLMVRLVRSDIKKEKR